MASSELCGLGAIALNELKNVDTLEHELRRLNSEITTLEGDFEQDITNYGQLTKRKADLERNVSALHEISTLEHIKLKQIMFDWRQADIIGIYMGKFEDYARWMESIKMKQTNLVDRHRELEQSSSEVLLLPIDDIKFRLAVIQEEITKKRAEALLSKEALRQVELNVLKTRSLIDDQRGINSSKTDAISNEITMCERLRITLANISDELSTLIKASDTVKEENAASLSALNSEIGALHSQIAIGKDAIHDLEKLCNEAMQEYQKVQNDVQSLSEALHQKKYSLQLLGTDVSSANEIISNYDNLIEGNCKAIAKIESDIIICQKIRSISTTPLAEVQMHRDSLIQTNKTLSDQIMNKEKEITEVEKRSESRDMSSKSKLHEITTSCAALEKEINTFTTESETISSALILAKSIQLEIRSQIDQNSVILSEIQAKLASNKLKLGEAERKKNIQSSSKQNDIDKLLQVQTSTKNELARLHKEIATFQPSEDHKDFNSTQIIEIEKYRANCEAKQRSMLSKLREVLAVAEAKVESQSNIKQPSVGAKARK